MKAAGGQEAFFAIDSQQRVVMWEAAAEALLGFEAEEALGRPCWQVLEGSDVFGRPLYCETCRACLRSGASLPPPAHHFLIKHKDGRHLRLVHELVPLPPGPGARALVLLGVASGRAGPVPDLAAPKGVALTLGSFGSMVKGLAALGLIADSLPSSGFYQTLDSALDRALNLTGAETAEVFLWDPSSRAMCLSAHRGLFRSAFRQITHFRSGQGFPGLVAATGEPLVTYELAQDPRYLRTRVKEKGVRFYMCMPLRAPRGVIGCMNIASRRLEEGQDPLQLLSWLAAPLASVVELTTLRSQEMVERAGEGELSPTAVPRHLLKAMMDASGADQGLMALWDPAGGLPVLVEARPRALRPCLGEGNGHLCPVWEVGHLQAVRSGAEALGRASCRGSLGEAREAICVPLVVGGRLLGVVSLRSLEPQPVPTRPLALLGAMAPRAARVLREAWPYLRKEDPPALEEYRPREMPERQLYVLQQPPAQGKRVMLEALEGGAVPFLDIRCFGSFQILRDGKTLAPASFGRRQSFTVLKILVTRRGRPVSRDFLTEALWPEAYPEAASRRLWVVIHSLRAGLEPGLKAIQSSHFVHRDGDTYCFNPGVPYRLDVQDFLEGQARGERLEAQGDPRRAAVAYQEAAQLYRGDFLEEETYSDWCSAEREYLREVYLSLLKRLASLQALWEDWDRSIAWHRRALLVDSLREEVHRELMRCLRRAGRRDEALRQYLDCRQVLEKELGVEPLPETELLYREILEEEKRQ